MGGEPTSSDPRVSQLLADISAKAAQSRANAQLTPEERKARQIDERISRRAYGGNVSFHEDEAQRRIMKAQASRESQRTQITRGQATLVGQPPKGPDR